MNTILLKNKKIIFLFFILTFLFYGNSLFNKYALDDEYVTVTNFKQTGVDYIPNHELVKKGFRGIKQIWKSRYAHDGESSFDYRPLVTTSFAIEYGIYGQKPFLSHLINVLLYFFIVCILFIVILKLFEEYKFNYTLAFLSSFIFLIHPSHTEVVNSLKCRDELFALLFCFISLWMCLKYIEKPSVTTIIIFIVCLLLGLFSKKTAILSFGIIPLCLFFYRKLDKKKLIIMASASLLIIVCYVFVKNSVIIEKTIKNYYHFENPLYTDNVSFFQRLLITMQSFGFYVKFLLAPYPFRFYYGANAIDIFKPVNTSFIIGCIFIGFLICHYLKYKNRHVLFSVLLFLGSIFPFLNLVTPVPGIVGERLTFFASIGFCIMLVLLLLQVFPKLRIESIQKTGEKPFIYFLPITLLCLIIVFNRNKNWHNKISLFEHDIPYLQNSSKANSLLANEYLEILSSPQKKQSNQTLINKCLTHYNLAIQNDSTFFSCYNNLGVIYFSYLNDFQKAKTYFLFATKYKKNYSQAYENLGNTYSKLKNISDAEKSYKSSIVSNPNQYSAYLSWIGMLFENKLYSKTLRIIEIALIQFPNNYQLTAQYANCLIFMGEMPTALIKFEEAYKLFPNKELSLFISQKYSELGNTTKANQYN